MTGWNPPPLPAHWRWTAELPPWVGRRVELDRLESLWPGVESGARQLVLVAGEAGAGKSRLVMEAARALHTRGVPVLVGACSSDFGLPFDPLVAPVRALLAAVDRQELTLADSEAGSADDARRLLAVLTAGGSAETGTSPFASVAFGAAVSALNSACRRGPVVIVLEDLHWAAESGLRALRYLVDRTTDLRLLLLATLRTSSADGPTLLSALTSELIRLPGVQRIDLDGFDTDEVASYLVGRRAGEQAAIRDQAALLRAATGGNPFLLGEIWRELERSGGIEDLASGRIRVPGSVRAVVAERLSRLDAVDRSIVSRAAVIGETFGVELLLRAGGSDGSARTYRALSAASSQGLIDAAPETPGRFRFPHALARQAVLEAMDPYELATAHAAIGLALERGRGSSDPVVVPQLAHYFSRAVGLGLESRAARYLEKSALIAERRLAHSDAADYFERAAEFTVGDRDRDALLIKAARSHATAGHFRQARTLGETLAVRAAGDVRLAAAIDYEEASYYGLGTGRAVEVLGLALRDTPMPESDPLRILAEAAYGRALVRNGRSAEGQALLDSAVRRARMLADERLLLAVLTRFLTLSDKPTPGRGFEGLKRQRQVADEVTLLAKRRGEFRSLNIAAQARTCAAYLVGDAGELNRALDDLLLTGRVTHEPFLRWRGAALTMTRQLMRCQFDAARESLLETRRLASTLELTDDADGAWSLQSFMLRRETGELEFARSMVSSGAVPDKTWIPGLVAVYTELGLARRAQALLRESVARGLSQLRDSATWPATLSFFTDAAVDAGDRTCAEVLAVEVERFAGHNLMSAEFLAAFGSGHRDLARLSAVLGRPHVEDHFAAALEMDARMGSVLHVATTHLEWATWLRRTDAPQDRVDEQVARAGELADRHGLVRVSRRLGDRAPTQGSPRRDDGLTGRELEVLQLIGRGLSNREIARELVISEHTAANHVRSILAKTQSANRTVAARYASRQGLMEERSDNGHQ